MTTRHPKRTNGQRTDLRERLEYTFDAYGRKTAEAAQANEGGCVEKRRTSFEYDSDDRMTATVHPGGARIEYAYDAAGNVRAVKDETHAAPNTTYAYDPAARLTEVRQTLGGATVTAYADPDGNLVSVTDPNGNLTTYVYDDFGRMLRQVSPVTGTSLYAYDPAGNMTATTDANGATTARTYDALGRVTSALSTRA